MERIDYLAVRLHAGLVAFPRPAPVGEMPRRGLSQQKGNKMNQPHTTTTNFTLRIPPGLAVALDVRAARAGISRQEFIAHVLAAEVGESQVIVGHWQVDGCQVGACVDCGHPLSTDTWLGATQDGRLVGPVCGACAGRARGGD